MSNIGNTLAQSGVQWENYANIMNIAGEDLTSKLADWSQEMIWTGLDTAQGMAEMQEWLSQEYGLTAEDAKKAVEAVSQSIGDQESRWSELTGYIQEADGAAQSMADVQLNNLEGQVTLLKSALEGVAIQFGTIIMPYVQKFVEKIAEVVDWIANLDEDSQKMIVTIAGVVAAIGPLLAIVGSVTKSIGNITMGVGKVIQYWPTILGAATKIGALISGTIIPAIGAMVSAILPFLPIIAAVAAAIAVVVVVIKNWGAITDWITEKWAALTQFLSEAVTTMVTFFQEHFGILGQIFAAGIENLSTIISTAVEVIQIIITTIGQVIKAIMEGDWSEVLTIIVNAWLKIQEAIDKAKEKIKQTIVKMLTGIKDKFFEFKDAAFHWGSDMIQNFIDGILAKWEALKETVANVANTVKDYLGFSEPSKGAMANFNTWPKHLMEQYAHGIENMRFVVQAAVSDVASDVAVLENPIDPTEIYDAVRVGASNANVSLSIGEREFSRSLRNMGVMFNG